MADDGGRRCAGVRPSPLMRAAGYSYGRAWYICRIASWSLPRYEHATGVIGGRDYRTR